MANRNQGEVDIDAMSTIRSYDVYEVRNSDQQSVENENLDGVEIDDNQPRYTFSNSQVGGSISNAARQSVGNGPAINANHPRGSIIDRSIKATNDTIGTKSYGGSYRRWPGILLFVLLIALAAVTISYFGNQTYTDSKTRGDAFAEEKFSGQQIRGGNKTDTVTDEDIISDDGVIGNPKKYPEMGCELPNYLSKAGSIVAVSANGTEVPLTIKGINWFGMETGQAVPFGLWDNSENGTTAYAIANFLHANKFNAVRLPLMVQSILSNREPNVDMVNAQENRAISLENYMSLLQGIVKALQFRRISVLLSMHTLTDKDSGKLWYNADISEDNFLEAIDILTENLCSDEYWNIMGIDLKNEPYQGTWGTGTATDFRLGAQLIGNRMLKGCDKWLGFVEGVNAQHTITIDGEDFGYYDWYGGGLQGAKTKGLEFDIPEKLVWAPHYYTPAVFPQYYLYGGGKVGAQSAIDGYIELDDETLKHRIDVTMDDMFGFLANTEGPALLLGEFGGLYSKDEHPMKTTKRCTDFTIELIKRPGWAGGFVWSLNPESAYQFNPADTPGHFTEGILKDDWLSADPDFLGAMANLDDMENLQPFPCFPTETSSSAESE